MAADPPRATRPATGSDRQAGHASQPSWPGPCWAWRPSTAAGLAFHARAATIGPFLTALADLTGVDTPASIGELVTSLADLPGQPRHPVVVDALDEAASHLDRRQITEALAELAALRGLRVAVATLPLAAGNPYAPGAAELPGRRDGRRPAVHPPA
jgi:hypothetical protein